MKIDKHTKIFITGCGGMLGEAIHNTFSQIATVLCTDIDLNSPFLTFGDVRDYSSMKKLISDFSPDLIIHLAALTDLEYCETHEDDVWETNAYGTEKLAIIARGLDIPIVYISTAGVFDGKKITYTEYDFPNPLNFYGKSKYAGELAVQKNEKYFIFRAGWMMGGGPSKDKKFINKIMKKINSGVNVLDVVDDKLGTPTYTYDFARNMLNVLQNGDYGLYHMVCKGTASRYDVAEFILKELNLKDIKLNKVDSDFFKKEYFVARPYSEQLIAFKLIKDGLYNMRDWKVSLSEYLKQWK